jgi:hypothetical protein
VLHRDHAVKAPPPRASPFATIKPLSRFFWNLGRVVLVDNELEKAHRDELRNLIHIPMYTMKSNYFIIIIIVVVVVAMMNLSSTDIVTHKKQVS